MMSKKIEIINTLLREQKNTLLKFIVRRHILEGGWVGTFVFVAKCDRGCVDV